MIAVESGTNSDFVKPQTAVNGGVASAECASDGRTAADVSR